LCWGAEPPMPPTVRYLSTLRGWGWGLPLAPNGGDFWFSCRSLWVGALALAPNGGGVLRFRCPSLWVGALALAPNGGGVLRFRCPSLLVVCLSLGCAGRE